ncbi:hypothetical protein [Methylobacterium sp. A52T]
MATHVHSTRTPLLRPSDRPQPLLGLGLGRQSGPVTIAIAAMRAADPDLERQRLCDLRRRIADRIEADLALLDALDGDADLEDVDVDLEDGHDAEGNSDDNGIADLEAAAEQGFPGYGRCV